MSDVSEAEEGRVAEEVHVRGHRVLGYAATGLLLMLYPLVFLRAYSFLGPQASAYFIVPVLTAAWFFGVRGALTVGAIGLPLGFALDRLVGGRGMMSLFGIGAALAAAVVFGHLRDTHEALLQKGAAEQRRLEEQGWLRSTLEADAKRRSEQHQLVTDLGRRALQGEDPRALMRRVVEYAARGLGTDYADLLEYEEATQRFIFRGVVGTSEDLTGRVIEAGRGSHSGYTLLVGQPVIVEDYSTDARFHMPIPTKRHRIVSGLSAIVGDPMGKPFGVMAVYAKARRKFSDDDLAYLQSLANVLALTVGPRSLPKEAPALDVRW